MKRMSTLCREVRDILIVVALLVSCVKRLTTKQRRAYATKHTTFVALAVTVLPTRTGDDHI